MSTPQEPAAAAHSPHPSPASLRAAVSALGGLAGALGRVPEELERGLDRVPWVGRSFGFERRLGPLGHDRLDLAVHADLSLVERAERAEELASHPAWRRVLGACRAVQAAGDPEVEVALEFDADRIEGLPVPVVFLVRDMPAERAGQRSFEGLVLRDYLPALRGERALPAGLRGGIERVLGALPGHARAVHFGSMAAREIEGVRVCVTGLSPGEVCDLARRLGLDGVARALAERGAPGSPGVTLGELGGLGDLRFINIDVLGPEVMPRLGAEIHFPGDGVGQVGPGAAAALGALERAGLIGHADAEQARRWAAGAAPGSARGVTHLKLEFRGHGGPAAPKLYAKVSPLARGGGRAAAALPRPTEPFAPSLLHAGFFAQAEARPDAVAVASAEGELTYRELASAADALAAELAERGVGRGDLVGMLVPHGPLSALAALAILRAGAAYVPLDPAYPDERCREILSQARPRLALVSPGREGAAPCEAVRLDVGALRAAPRAAPRRAEPSPEDRAYVIFTSGSTGRPKGVVIAHRSAANTIQDINEQFEVTARDRVLALSSMAFDLSVYDVFGTLAAGGCVVFPDPGGEPLPARALRALRARGVTVWNSVPTTMALALELDEPGGDALRLVMLSGDWIPTRLPAAIRARFPGASVISLGGSTEASIWSILRRIGGDDGEGQSIPYGAPTSMRGQAIWVLDEAMAPCAVGEPGELYIAGEGVARGYLNDPERSAERFVPSPLDGRPVFRTGDLGKLREDGVILFLGRRDAQVKIQGYRVDTSEVEAHLSRLPGVKAAAVAATGQPPRLRAVVVPEPGHEPSVAGWLARLSSSLPRYAVPLAPDVEVADALPLGPNGKVDRKALAQGEAAPPVSLEESIAALCAQALGRGGVGPDDDLAALGADSLSAAWLSQRIGALTGVAIGYHHFAGSPTPRKLAQACRGEGGPPRRRARPELAPCIDARALPPWSGSRGRILITGATGYLGAHVLASVLRGSSAQVTALVRGPSEQAALEKLAAAARSYGLEADTSRVRVVLGDLAAPGLGLGAAAAGRLAAEIDVIIHSGAEVSFALPAEALEATNVRATERLLELAAAGQTKYFVHISTLAAHGFFRDHPWVAREEPLPDPPPDEAGGYAQTKWAAESLVEQARGRGVPAAVVRPGFLLGGAAGGRRDRDMMVALLRLCARHGAAPDLGWSLPAVRVADAADAIARLALDGARGPGSTLHLAPSRELAWREVVGWLREQGHAVRSVPYPTFRGLVDELSAGGDPCARVLLHALPARGDLLHAPRVATARAEQLLGPVAAISPDTAREALQEPRAAGPDGALAGLEPLAPSRLGG